MSLLFLILYLLYSWSYPWINNYLYIIYLYLYSKDMIFLIIDNFYNNSEFIIICWITSHYYFYILIDPTNDINYEFIKEYYLPLFFFFFLSLWVATQWLDRIVCVDSQERIREKEYWGASLWVVQSSTSTISYEPEMMLRTKMDDSRLDATISS